MRRLLSVVAVAAFALACVHQRSIVAPVPGAVETTFPDSVQYVLTAIEHAIGDEGITIRFDDRKHGFVEARPIGAATLRTRNPGGIDYSGPEGIVVFRFFARQELGVTRVTAEAVYNPVRGGGRASERMVPADHVAREVIDRMFGSMEKRLDDDRAEREQRQRDARP